MKELQKYIDETVSKTVLELKRQGLLKDNRQTPFQKTEQLLYNYNNFLNAVRDKESKIEDLKQSGIHKKSKSITSFNGSCEYEMITDSERVEDKIREIRESIIVTKNLISIVDDAISKLKDDPYYDLIRLKYFEEKTREEIAEILNVDVSTISRNKNRLINMLKITLFSDDVITEIFA